MPQYQKCDETAIQMANGRWRLYQCELMGSYTTWDKQAKVCVLRSRNVGRGRASPTHSTILVLIREKGIGGLSGRSYKHYQAHWQYPTSLWQGLKVVSARQTAKVISKRHEGLILSKFIAESITTDCRMIRLSGLCVNCVQNCFVLSWYRPMWPKRPAIRCYWFCYVLAHNQFAWYWQHRNELLRHQNPWGHPDWTLVVSCCLCTVIQMISSRLP